MAVDGAVVDIDLVVIGRVHQRVAAFHHAGAGGERLQDEELGDRQGDRLVLPGAGMALRIHAQQAALEHLGVGFLRRRGVLRRGAAQHRLHALDQEPLRERFADEVVGAHLEAEHFVDLLVLGGEEDDRMSVFWRSRRSVSMPSMRGILMSRMARSGGEVLKPSSAEAPSV